MNSQGQNDTRGPGIPRLDCLPYELTILIHNYLPDARDVIALSRTCQRLRAVAEEEGRIFERLTFPATKARFADSALFFAMKYGPRIKELVLQVEAPTCRSCWHNCGGSFKSTPSDCHRRKLEDEGREQDEYGRLWVRPPLAPSAVALLRGNDLSGNAIDLPALEKLCLRFPHTDDFGGECIYFEDFDDEGKDLKNLCTRNTAVADAALEALATTMYFPVGSSVVLQLVNLPPRTIIHAVIPYYDPKPPRHMYTREQSWDDFLGRIQHLDITFFTERGATGSCADMLKYNEWLRGIRSTFLVWMTSLKSLALHASESVPVVDECIGGGWISSNRPTMRSLERLELNHVRPDPSYFVEAIHDMQYRGYNQPLSITLVNTAMMDGSSWADFLRKFIDRGIVLSELNIRSALNTPARLEQMEACARCLDEATDPEVFEDLNYSQGVSKIKRELKENPKRVFFEYKGEYDVGFCVYRFLEGEDEDAYQQVLSRIKKPEAGVAMKPRDASWESEGGNRILSVRRLSPAEALAWNWRDKR